MNSRSDKWGFCWLYGTDLSYYERQLISTKRSYVVVIKFVLLSLIKSVHYQTYVKYQIKSPSSHCNIAGFLCITYCLCAYHCWCWLLRFWLGKTSPSGQQIIYIGSKRQQTQELASNG